MPLQRVNDHVSKVLGMLITAGQVFATGRRDRIDSKDHGHGPDLVSVLVFGHTDQVLVEVLRRLQVLSDALLILV